MDWIWKTRHVIDFASVKSVKLWFFLSLVSANYICEHALISINCPEQRLIVLNFTKISAYKMGLCRMVCERYAARNNIISKWCNLTANSILRGGTTPLTEEKVVKKGQMQSIWFFQVLSKFFWTIFKTIFEILSALGLCLVTIIGGWYTRNPRFLRFLEHNSASFSHFVMKYFLVERSYWIFAIDIKSLNMGAQLPWKQCSMSPFLPFLTILGFCGTPPRCK